MSFRMQVLACVCCTCCSVTRFALQVALRRLDFDPDEALTTLSQEVRYVRYASARRAPAWFFRMVAGLRQAAGEAKLELTSQPFSQTLYVRPTAGVYIVVAAHSSAVVTIPDIAAGRSVLHVIDSVLLPRAVEVEL